MRSFGAEIAEGSVSDAGESLLTLCLLLLFDASDASAYFYLLCEVLLSLFLLLLEALLVLMQVSTCLLSHLSKGLLLVHHLGIE